MGLYTYRCFFHLVTGGTAFRRHSRHLLNAPMTEADAPLLEAAEKEDSGARSASLLSWELLADTLTHPLQRQLDRIETAINQLGLQRAVTSSDQADVLRDLVERDQRARTVSPGIIKAPPKRPGIMGELDPIDEPLTDPARKARYCPELQARGEGMNATLLEHLDLVRRSPDRATAYQFSAEVVQMLVRYGECGLVQGAICQYLDMLSGALRQVAP